VESQSIRSSQHSAFTETKQLLQRIICNDFSQVNSIEHKQKAFCLDKRVAETDYDLQQRQNHTEDMLCLTVMKPT